jgi:4'-phosphopantetheinyl transferase
MSRGPASRAGASGVAVDLWCIELAPDVDRDDAALLAADERARAARFVFDHDRDRYVAAHAALRRILAVYSRRPAAALRFVHERQGRPRIEGVGALDFNLSHSGNLALIGVASHGPIGVDIEAARPAADRAALAERYFSRAEAAALGALPPALRDRAFLTCWTRKEACLKATGAGLSADTRGIEVGIEARRWRVALRHEGRDVELTVVSCDLPQDAVAAVAVAQPAETLRSFARTCAELRRCSDDMPRFFADRRAAVAQARGVYYRAD